MTALEREYLTLWIASDFAALLVQEMPAQVEALKSLTAEIDCACARGAGQAPPREAPVLTAEEESFLSAISAPENAHLFSLDAVSNAFAHTKKLRPDMTPQQREALTFFIAHDIAGLLLHECGQRDAFEALMTELERGTKKWVAELQRTVDKVMTQPHQRTRALLKTIRFLDELTRPGDTPRVPAHTQDTARQLLLHFPGFDEIEAAHKALPEVFGPVVQRQAEGMPSPVKRGKRGD